MPVTPHLGGRVLLYLLRLPGGGPARPRPGALAPARPGHTQPDRPGAGRSSAGPGFRDEPVSVAGVPVIAPPLPGGHGLVQLFLRQLHRRAGRGGSGSPPASRRAPHSAALACSAPARPASRLACGAVIRSSRLPGRHAALVYLIAPPARPNSASSAAVPPRCSYVLALTGTASTAASRFSTMRSAASGTAHAATASSCSRPHC